MVFTSQKLVFLSWRMLLTLSLLCVVSFTAVFASPGLAKVKGPSPDQIRAKLGISDVKEVYGDPRLKSLDLHFARTIVIWTRLRKDPKGTLKNLTNWVNHARSNGFEPEIAFGVSQGHRIPNAQEFAELFRKVHKAVHAKSYTLFNEANIMVPNLKSAKGIAALDNIVAGYKSAKKTCGRGCEVAPVSIVEYSNMLSWVRTFKKRCGCKPSRFDFHNYPSVSFLKLGPTQKFIKEVNKGSGPSARVDITETGAVIYRKKPRTKIQEGLAHSADVMKFIVDSVLPLDQIGHVFVYHWSAGPRGSSPWDSGLIGPEGPRPSYQVLCEKLLGASGACS